MNAKLKACCESQTNSEPQSKRTFLNDNFIQKDNVDLVPTSYTLYRTTSFVAITFFKSLNKLLTNKASKPSCVCAILERDLMACKQKQ